MEIVVTRFIWSLKNTCLMRFLQSICLKLGRTERQELIKTHVSHLTNHHLEEHCCPSFHHNVHSDRQRGQFSTGIGEWVCNAIKWLLHPVWSAAFHSVLLILNKNLIRRSHHVFPHQTWWMTMFPLCLLFISSLRLLRAVVIRSSPALYTISYCGEKQP